MRLMPASLHGRMLLLSAVATIVALGIAGLSIAGLLERLVVEGLDRRLDSEVTLLAGTVDGDGRIDRARLQARAGLTESGPGWRWQIAGPDGTIGSADFPALADIGPPLPGPGPLPPRTPPTRPGRPERLTALEGASEYGVAVHARRITLQTPRGPVTIIAAAPRDVVRWPVRAAMWPLLAALLVLGVLLTTAMLVQLRIGLRPLRVLRDQVAAIRGGTRTQVTEDQPSELRPLAVELNALAADNAAALATARASAVNLAHALKTPVATLAIDLRDQPQAAAQVARIDATIRHHLARARTATANHRAATSLAPAVAGLGAVIRRLHGDRTLTLDIADDLSVAVDAHDLDELLGNLLDNAARHARGQVVVTAARVADDARRIAIVITDDGPGIPSEDRARVAQPGTRLDERGDGHGFGLTIAADLVALYGGTLTLDDAPGGGLCVRLELPAGAYP
ncbi:histidine kinase [Sphingomonas sp. Leaf33]|uniref:ATP-binding protein n=1 Tax=Sphingomonas sp. Leaf33 TaxID=1736215 RepID=UPI0006F3599B|nr:ATP-binding protein [Sphingomonas sp. Leaf33]KQN20643.1 histidine kinase [Sphingomonas sp. Leaf33]